MKNFNLTKDFYFSYTYNLTIKFQETACKKVKQSHTAQNAGDIPRFNFLNKDKDSEEPSETNEFSSFVTTNLAFGGGTERPKIEEFHAEDYYPWNEKFQWNYYLIKEFFSLVKDKRWVLPIMHGYIH